jgi:hypothetical protein
MGIVTQYKLSNFQSQLGGSNPASMSEYYRGVAFVPHTGPNALTREPTSGQYYVRNNYPNEYFWIVNTFYGGSAIQWLAGSYGGILTSIIPVSATTYTEGDSIFYRGTLQSSVGSEFSYAIFRFQTTYGAINTSVPSSGSITFNNLYGAENYSPGYMGGIYLGTLPGIVAYYTGSNTTITATFTMSSNGTWAFTRNDGQAGSSGNWGSATGNYGVNYWVKFTRLGVLASNDALALANSTATTGWLNLASAQAISVQTFNNANPDYAVFLVSYIAQIALDSAGADIINESYSFTIGATYDPP